MLTDPVDAFIVWLAAELGEDVRGQVPAGLQRIRAACDRAGHWQRTGELHAASTGQRLKSARTACAAGYLYSCRVVEATRNLSSVEIDVDGVSHLIRTVTHESGPFTDEDEDARAYTLGTFVVTGSRYSV